MSNERALRVGNYHIDEFLLKEHRDPYRHGRVYLMAISLHAEERSCISAMGQLQRFQDQNAASVLLQNFLFLYDLNR